MRSLFPALLSYGRISSLLPGAVIAVLLPLSAGVAGNTSLPELGDSAEQILTPIEERDIGRQFRRQLIRNRAFVNDPELFEYLNRLGASVALHASLRGTPITVNLLENSELNAFAVPGGYITFHTGLILTTEQESELAAVMAHEIAHITQRHLPRMLAKAEASKLPVTAAILASILVGGQVGLAGLTVANATLLSNQLAYTRDFEREADSIGVRLMAEAGYDPTAMAGFFGKMERYNGGLGEKVPEFLRTHPLSYTRIAEAEDRASSYPVVQLKSSRAFELAKAKIRAMYSPRDHDTIGYFKDQIANTSGDQQLAAIYGTALSQRELRQYDEARATIIPLSEAYPDEVAFQVALGEIDLAAGNTRRAAARYQQLRKSHAELTYLTYYHGNALLANGDAAAAKKIVRYQLRRNKEMFQLYPLLAKANVKLGILAEAHQANAEFHAALGEYQQAVSSLKLALRENDSDGYLQQSITARLQQMEEALSRQKNN